MGERYLENCIFCKIVRKESPAEFLRESDDFVIIKDIHPSAPIHYLIVSKAHIPSLVEVGTKDHVLLGRMAAASVEGAGRLGLSGYKLVFNVGRDGGQIIDHLHAHLIGGWKGGEPKKVNV